MKELIYTISISASKEEVWNTIIGSETYDQWVKAFSPNSTYKGEWKQGAEMLFWDPDMGGTTALLEVFKPHDLIVAHHINTVTKDGIAETTGEMTEKWIGTRETYRLSEQDGLTTLSVEMRTDAAFEEMFDKCWPQALENIKKLSEGHSP